MDILAGIENISPHMATAIIAMSIYLVLDSFNIHKNFKFSIAVVVAAFLGFIFNGHIDQLGVELMSSLAGVAISAKVMSNLSGGNNAD